MDSQRGQCDTAQAPRDCPLALSPVPDWIPNAVRVSECANSSKLAHFHHCWQDFVDSNAVFAPDQQQIPALRSDTGTIPIMKLHSRHSSASLRGVRSNKNRNEGTKDGYPSYHDFCTLSLSRVEELTSTADQARYRGGKKSTFPRALYDLLLESEMNCEYEEILAWQPHGRSFLVKDKVRFERDVLPRHFGCQSSFASFQRQLNVYGFLRMTKAGPDRKSYYHELFLRGRPDLLSLMPRKRSTTAPVRRSLDPSTEPNLYRFPPSIPDQQPKEDPKTAELVTSENPAPLPEEPTSSMKEEDLPICCSPPTFPPPRTISTDMDRLLSEEALAASSCNSSTVSTSSSEASLLPELQQPHSPPGSLQAAYPGGLLIPSTLMSALSPSSSSSSSSASPPSIWMWDASSVTPDVSWHGGEEADDAMAEFLDEVDFAHQWD